MDEKRKNRKNYDSATINPKDVLLSTWTPLGNDDANHKVYYDRKQLLVKWFEKWNDSQREDILMELLLQCRMPQWRVLKEQVHVKLPETRLDFTRIFPRALCLYIFSFLDPRSLCRASQASWYWKYLCDSNEIWSLKCARLGWFLNSPGASDCSHIGLWKRHYIENIIDLQVTRPARMLAAIEKDQQEAQHRKAIKEAKRQLKAAVAAAAAAEVASKKQLPWRAPCRTPTDTRRNNYLDNEVVLGPVGDPHKDGRRSANPNDPVKLLSQQMARKLMDETLQSMMHSTQPTTAELHDHNDDDDEEDELDSGSQRGPTTESTQPRPWEGARRPCGRQVFHLISKSKPKQSSNGGEGAS